VLSKHKSLAFEFLLVFALVGAVLAPIWCPAGSGVAPIVYWEQVPVIYQGAIGDFETKVMHVPYHANEFPYVCFKVKNMVALQCFYMTNKSADVELRTEVPQEKDT
jgi:hypothetical protein